MKIISWNVNGIRAWHKKGCFSWFHEKRPDIFCLQETKAEISQIPQEILNLEGYFSYFDHSKGRKGYSGVGIMSHVKPLNVTFGLGVDELDQEGRLITLEFEDFFLLNCYFPNSGGGPERLAFKLKYYDAFLKYIEKLKNKGKGIVFCGDINTAHEALDLARPKENEKNTGFLPEERAWIDKVVSKGYVDIFRQLHPTKVQYSYWDMKTFARDRNVGWRIDYFFVSQDLESRVKKAGILDDVFGSDHCPVLLDIGF